MSVLSAFTDQKKIRPVYQFKRGTTFASLKHPGVDAFRPAAFPSNKMVPKSDSMLIQSVSPSSSTSSTAEGQATPDSGNSTPSVPDDEDDDAIFDFPTGMNEFVEIKVMVASNRRTIPEVPKLTRKRSKPKKNTSPVTQAKKKATPKTTTAAATITTTTTMTTSKPKSPVNQHTKTRPIPTGRPSALPPKEPVAPTAISSHVLACDDQGEFDIFAFDPQPTSHLTSKRKPKPKPKAKPIMTALSSPSSRLTPTHYTANTTYTPPLPAAYHTHPYHHASLHQPISIASLLNEPLPLQPYQAHPVEKKRKRNLVAHLKTASGEKENKHLQEFDCLSDEDDLALELQKSPPLLPLQTLIKEPSLSPELSYNETMQMQLDSLMQSEFGELPQQQQQQQSSQSSAHKRPQYQPSNKLNVRMTFQKKQ